MAKKPKQRRPQTSAASVHVKRKAATARVRSKPPRSPDRDKANRQFAVEVARLMGDRHCENVIVLDVHGRNDLADYFVIGSGTSDRQIRGVGAEIEDLAAQRGLQRFGQEMDTRATWVVLDFVDVVIHLFDPGARAHYDLEMFWGDAPRLRWRRTKD